MFRKLKNNQISSFEFTAHLSFPIYSLIRTVYDTIVKAKNGIGPQVVDDQLRELGSQHFKDKYIWWEGWRLMERFIIAALSVFLTNPIYRILYITPVFAFFWYLHSKISPYKRSMFLLKRLDAVSWVCLLIIALLNQMRAVVYIYNIPNVDSIYYALKAADILEQMFSPLWYFIIAYILMKLGKKFNLPYV